MNKFIAKEKITIGVASYGNLKSTKICLKYILNSIDGNFELILVEDCSSERNELIDFYVSIKEKIPNTKIFSFSKNLTYTNSVNCILSHSTGEKVFFISNDVYINPYFIKEMLDISNLSKNIGVVRGVSNFVDNNLPSHNVKIEGSKEVTTEEDIRSTSKKTFELNTGKYIEDKYLTGDVFLVNREILNKVGYYDTETFTGYFSDHDYSSRVISHDYLCVLAQGAFAFHHKDINFSYLEDKKKLAMKRSIRFAQVHENWARFKLKYSLQLGLLYPGTNQIPWNETFKEKTEYVDKKDYSEYLI
jgi:GT2 family glycosyltransferase